MAARQLQPPSPDSAAKEPLPSTPNPTPPSPPHSPSLRALFLRAVDPSSPSSWSSAISDLLSSGDSLAALATFSSARRLAPAALLRSALPPALRAAAAAASLPSGRQLHLLALRSGLFPSDPFAASSLLHMYSCCSRPLDARRAFDEIPCPNPVVVTSMVSGYVRNHLPRPALSLFRAMVSTSATTAVDEAAAVAALSASARLPDHGATRGLHGLFLKLGLDGDAGVANTMLDAYAKGGGRNLGAARKVFDMMEKDVVSWNSMIALYAQNGLSAEALRLYSEMTNGSSVRCNAVTLSAVLFACAHAGVIQTGKHIHNQVVRMGLEENVYVGTSVVDMYSKCGRVQMARKAFNRIKEKNILSWSAMIAGYGMQGHGQEALKVFDEMRTSGLRPNYITFVSVLAACSHAGLLDEGRHWYKAMKKEFDIEPGVEHYGCMVDLLGRAGCLDEAYGLIKEMKIKPDSVVWGALLSACRIHKNVELGEISANKLFELDATNCGYYVLLSHIYADAGKWKDMERMRVLIKQRGIVKPPGYSSVELKGKTHVFFVGDRRHPQHKEIFAYLEKLLERIQEAGYVPDTGSVLHDLDMEEKESVLRIHSEKLAVAFAIMNSVPGTVIHVIKNLRVCGDCHKAIKFIAKLVEQEIIVRDLHRFHHFKDGECSCGDYW